MVENWIYLLGGLTIILGILVPTGFVADWLQKRSSGPRDLLAQIKFRREFGYWPSSPKAKVSVDRKVRRLSKDYSETYQLMTRAYELAEDGEPMGKTPIRLDGNADRKHRELKRAVKAARAVGFRALC